MISDAPELETRVESCLTRTFKEAFPDAVIGSWSEPKERGRKSIGVKCDLIGEEPQGTNIFDASVSIEGRNLDHLDRDLMRRMLGSSAVAKDTITAYGAGKFRLPAGQPVAIESISRSAEDETERVITYSLSLSIQPI